VKDGQNQQGAQAEHEKKNRIGVVVPTADI
jgi:hypothetical protein